MTQNPKTGNKYREVPYVNSHSQGYGNSAITKFLVQLFW